MRNIAVLLTLCAASQLFWQPLRGQAPGVGINAGKKKPDNSTRSEKATDTSGTKENPLVVDALGHQQTPDEREEAKKQAAKSEAEEQYHRSVDRWTIRWTGITAISTAVLVLVGIAGTIAAILTLRRIKRQADLMNRQGVLMLGQLREMRASGKQMERMLKHAGRQARHAAKQTAAMEGHVRAVESSASASVISAQAAKSSADSLLGVERARLHVHAENAAGNEMVAKFWVRNYGRTPGWITKIACDYQKVSGSLTIDYVEKFATIPPNENGWIVPPNTDSKVMYQKLSPNGLLNAREEEMVQTGELILLLAGVVKYRDVFGMEWETRFSQNFAPGRGWFLYGTAECNKKT